MSYARTQGDTVWTYATGYATWALVATGLDDLMNHCVSRGSGGAVVLDRESLN